MVFGRKIEIDTYINSCQTMQCKEERKMPRKPSLDGKDSSLRIRMSPEQKEKLVSYVERHYQTMSNVIFQALDILYAREEQQNNKE